MREVTLEPNWENVAKWMARALRDNTFDSETAKYEFSTQYGQILAYLRNTDFAAYQRVAEFANRLSDAGNYRTLAMREHSEGRHRYNADAQCATCEGESLSLD